MVSSQPSKPEIIQEPKIIREIDFDPKDVNIAVVVRRMEGRPHRQLLSVYLASNSPCPIDQVTLTCLWPDGGDVGHPQKHIERQYARDAKELLGPENEPIRLLGKGEVIGVDANLMILNFDIACGSPSHALPDRIRVNFGIKSNTCPKGGISRNALPGDLLVGHRREIPLWQPSTGRGDNSINLGLVNAGWCVCFGDEPSRKTLLGEVVQEKYVPLALKLKKEPMPEPTPPSTAGTNLQTWRGVLQAVMQRLRF
jgi:hypothetical protein